MRKYCITHKSLKARSIDAFYKIVSQMVRELQLLLRMQAAEISNQADSSRIDELTDLLKGLQCTYCGQEVLNHVETHSAE